MNIWTYVGYLGILFTAIQLLPQILKSLKTKQVADVSLGLILIVMINAIIWIAYGLHLGDQAIFIANTCNLICSLIMLTLKLKGSQASL